MSSLIPRISFFILLLICGIAIEAQVPERKPVELTGTVNDPYGAVVTGASIRSNSKSSPDLVTKTDIKGKYRLVLAPGEYLITIQAPGFKKLEYRGLRIIESQTAETSFDFGLEISEDHEPCGYGGHRCFDDLSPEPIKSNPPIIDTKVQLRPAPRTSEDEKTKLPDHVMKKIVRRIVTWYFKPSPKPRNVYLADRHLKREWLPKIRNVNFVVLDDDAVTMRLNPDGVYDKKRGVYHFGDIDRENGNYVVSFGYGNPGCGAKGELWNVRIVKERVRISMAYGGWASSCHAVAAQTNVFAAIDSRGKLRSKTCCESR